MIRVPLLGIMRRLPHYKGQRTPKFLFGMISDLGKAGYPQRGPPKGAGHGCNCMLLTTITPLLTQYTKSGFLVNQNCLLDEITALCRLDFRNQAMHLTGYNPRASEPHSRTRIGHNAALSPLLLLQRKDPMPRLQQMVHISMIRAS